MNLDSFIHTKVELLEIIFDSYLIGYSIEEIYWRLNIFGYDISFDDINYLLDCLLECNY